MDKFFNNIILAAALTATIAGMTACSGPDDIVESVNYNRPFTPTELEAKVQNTTNVKLSWECLSSADANMSYAIELYADDPDMTFAGTPLKYTAQSSPYTVTELEGETTYSVRVKSLRSGVESAWAKTTFETGTEQIFFNPEPAEIGKTWITLSWPEGSTVTKLTVVKSGEVIQEFNLTADEIAEGKKTVENLDVERTYTFYLYNGEKQRGKIQVQTLPNYTPVTTAEELKSAINHAEDGEVIMLTENAVYDFTDMDGTTSIEINKPLALKSNNGATIKGVYFQIVNGASFEFANIILDGEGGTGDQPFAYKEDGNYQRLYIHDCEVKNFTKGFFYINVKALIDDITISNCIIHDVVCSGGDFFDSRAGGYNTFNVTNNTFYNCAAERDFIRMDDASANISATPVITVDHNTLYNVGANGANYRLLYVRFAGNTIAWTNNIVANTNYKRGFTNQAATSEPTFKNNFYFNTVNLVSAGPTCDDKTVIFDTDGKVVETNPFKDPENADFTVTDVSISDKGAGDPRWLPTE